MGADFLKILLKEEVTPWEISQNMERREKNADSAVISSRLTELKM